MGKFAWLIGVAACALGSGAWASPGNSPAATDQAFQTALAQHNLYAAGVALNDLVEARLPAKDTGKPDPLLDRLFADLFAASGHLSSAGPILRRVLDDPATPEPDHYRLLFAAYEESTGAWPDAESRYRQIASDPKASPETALSARFGIARLQMASDPSAALATLAAIDRNHVPANMAWEVDLLIERAANMAGPDKAATAAAALDRAWAEAANAAVADGAVAQVAGDRALAAGRKGDRETLIAMLGVDRSSRGANQKQNMIASDLPICGTGGITPQDVVIIDVAHQPPAGRPAIALAWASRPGIAAPFLLAAERSDAPSVTDGLAASFALRCRTVPSEDYVARSSIMEDIGGWMTERGAYSASNADTGDGLSSLATRLAQRQARYGSNSVMLLPLLFRTAMPGMVDFSDPESRKHVSEVADHITAILQQNHAPASLMLMWRLSSIGVAVMAQTKTEAEGQAEMQALLQKMTGDPALPLDTLYTLTNGTADMPTLPTEFKQTMLTSTLDLLMRKAPAGDQRTAAIALRLYQLRAAAGDKAGAREAIAKVDMPRDACELSDPQPRYVSSNITADDYPGDLAFMTMPGVSTAEFDLDASGAAQNGRLLLEDPPYAFDQIALARIPTIHYDPARFDGKVSACRGIIQNIRWQMPNNFMGMW